MAPTMIRFSSSLRFVILLVLCSPAATFSPSNPIRVNSVHLSKSSVELLTRSYLQRQQSLKLPPLQRTAFNNDNEGLAEETNGGNIEDDGFDLKSTIAIVGGQSLFIGGAAIAALVVGTPNLGLGPDFAWNNDAVWLGVLYTLPLGAISFILDRIEKNFPSLQDVTKATNRSVLALLGGTFKPVVAIITAVGLGLAAGIGEEMLFRGVLQWEMGRKFGNFVAVAASSVIFGVLHAVTPLYAILATLASIYFGFLYISSGNLLVPIVTHGFYDFCALFYAHWTVSKMSKQEQREIAEWSGPIGSGDDKVSG